MADNVDVLYEVGQNRLEQVYINMPEVRFYFSGDREQTKENLTAYLGEEQLELQQLQIFSETEAGVNYYLLLDVSASITKSEFGGIAEALSEFCETVRPQDHVTCITFGEDVETLFELDGQKLMDGQATELLCQMTNPDQETLLYEAINQMAELCESVPASACMRRVALVITDGEDFATGKATRDEALAHLQESGIPVYGFVAESSDQSELNAFGEFSRSTGGYLTILEKGAEQYGLEAVREEILQSYEAVFVADSNVVSNEFVSAVLQFGTEGEKQQLKVMQERWISDTEAPEISEVSVESAKQIKVIFTEAVTGAEAADNYRLKSETASLIPAFASPGSDGKSVVLSFAEDIPGGSYQLECSNIVDCSMEKNLLEEEASVEIETVMEMAETPPIEEKSNFWKDYGWLFVLAVLAILAAAALSAVKRLKKRKVILTMDGKAVLSDNVAVSHHVSIEKKQLEEKMVYFHVLGQKEEIPINIQKSMIVGRSSVCELVFDDPALSRQHFALELKNGSIMIQNLSQSGFTEVNGMKLDTSARRLRSGDEIHAGQIKMTIRW